MTAVDSGYFWLFTGAVIRRLWYSRGQTNMTILVPARGEFWGLS